MKKFITTNTAIPLKVFTTSIHTSSNIIGKSIMSFPQGSAQNFPLCYFSPPPPFDAPPTPPSRSPPPPPPRSSPPPPRYFSPPPPPTSPPPKQFSPPPPHFYPPPPHVLSPPPPISPIPSPGSHHGAVIVIVFVSFGGVLFLALALAGLCCFIKKTKKRKESSQEVEILSVDRHFKIKETIERDSHGKEEVAITFEEDDHVEEKIMTNEEFVKAYNHQRADGIESGTSSSSSYHHHLPH